MHHRHINLRARRQTIAHQALAIVRPARNHHGQLLVVVVQAPQAVHVAVQPRRRVRHQVAGAIAQHQLAVLAALHRARRVTVQPVHVQLVLVRKATAALLDAHRSRLRIVLDVAHGDLTTVRNVRADGEVLGLGRHQIRHVFGAQRVHIGLGQHLHAQPSQARVAVREHAELRLTRLASLVVGVVLVLLVRLLGRVQGIADAQFRFHGRELVATLERHRIPGAIGQRIRAVTATQSRVICEIRVDTGGDLGLFAALFDRVKGFAAKVHDLAEHLFEGEIVLAPESG